MGVARPLLLHEMTREEANAIAPRAIALLPTGATEQHGPHLPTGTDTFAVEHIAREAAARVSPEVPVVVAPTLPFGSSGHHLAFGGTMSIGTETYYRLMSDLTESLIVSGFQRVFILNGHGGNNELVQLVVRDLALKHPVDLAAASYWVAAWDALIVRGAHEQGRLPGHAGAFETSLVLALQPQLVKEPRPHRDDAAPGDPRSFYPPVRVERHGSWQEIDGYSDSPDRATAERGRLYLDTAITEISSALTEFYNATGGNG
jgi:creatinine amidohydrolase